jgi:cytochrome c
MLRQKAFKQAAKVLSTVRLTWRKTGFLTCPCRAELCPVNNRLAPVATRWVQYFFRSEQGLPARRSTRQQSHPNPLPHTMKTSRLVLQSTVLGLAIASSAPAVFANQALAKKNNCLACHAAATKLVGPAYQDVAAKYSGQSDAVDTLAKSMRRGSAGKWGELAMPPHPQLSQADAKKLALWILSGAK